MKIEQSYMHRSSQPASLVKDTFGSDPELTHQQKLKNIKRTGIACAFGIVLSLPQFIMPFFFGDEVIQSLQVQLIVYGAINFILCLVGFSWSRSQSILGNKSSSYGGFTGDDITIFYNPLGDCLFGFGSLFAVVNLLMTYLPFALYGFNRAQYIAEFGEESSQLAAFNKNYQALFITYGILSFIIAIILSISAYASYHCSATFKTLRIFGNLYNIAWGFFCVWGAYTVKKIQGYLALSAFKSLISSNLLEAAYIILLIYASFSFVVYLVITLKKRTPHVTLGTFFLVLIVVLTGMNYGIAKSSFEIKRSFTKDCVNQLNELPDSELANFGCTKYVMKDNQLDTSCKDSETLNKYYKFNWEQSVKDGKPFYVSTLENACLNGNCCRSVGYYYAYYPYQLYFIFITLTLIGLLITYICFHLSHKEKIAVEGKKDFQFNIVDGLFFLLLLSLVIGTCVVLRHTTSTLPDLRSKHISTEAPPQPQPEPQPEPQPNPEPKPTDPNEPTQPNFKLNVGKNAWLNDYINENVLSMKEYSNKECQLVKNLISDDLFQGSFDFNVDESSEGKGIRVSILASRGNFKYEKDNSGKLFFLETDDVKNIVFSFISNNSAKKNMPFFSILGLPQDVNTFLNTQLYYCGTNPSNLPHFLIENYVVDVPKIAPSSENDKSQEGFKKSIQHGHSSKLNKMIKSTFAQTSPGTAALVEKYEKYIESKKQNSSQGSLESGDSYPQEQCQNFYNEELKRTDICNFYQGNVADRKGSFSFITKSLKIGEAKQNIVGRVVAIDSKDSTQIKYIPVCNQNVIVNVFNEVGQEVLLAQATTDSATGQFTFSIPTLPSTVRYSAKLLISNKSYQDTVKIIQLGGLNSEISQQLGDIHLTNIYSKPQELQASNQCTGESIVKTPETNMVSKKSKQNKSSQKQNKEKSLNPLEKKTNLVDNWCDEYTKQKNINDKYCPFNSLFSTSTQQPVSSSFALFQTQQSISGEQELPPISRFSASKIQGVQFRNIEIHLNDILLSGKKDTKSSKKATQDSKQVSVSEGAVIKLYQNNVNCSDGLENSNPLFVGEVESSDNLGASLTVYNQILGDYTLEVTYKNRNYHSYCQPFTLAYDGTNTNFVLNAPIVRRNMSYKGSGVVVLENRFLQNGSEHLGATLGMSIVFNEDKECLVSAYNRQCADHSYVKTQYAQAISFKNTYNRNSLFFVSKMANTPSEQTLVEKSRVQGKEIPNDPSLRVNNSVFLQQDIVVKVYVPESEYEVSTYYPPIYDSRLSSNTQLTWLAFCFDGNYGLISQKPINQYYDNQTKKSFPSASFCDSFYKSNPFQGPK
ncbi:hypothetical protein ABPG74_018817 [Tetrahymena malaccensis]